MRIDPNLLIKYGLTFDEVVQAVETNNRNVGGGNVSEGTRSVLVQGVGRTTNVEADQRRSSSPPKTACRFAWATSAKW